MNKEGSRRKIKFRVQEISFFGKPANIGGRALFLIKDLWSGINFVILHQISSETTTPFQMALLAKKKSNTDLNPEETEGPRVAIAGTDATEGEGPEGN